MKLKICHHNVRHWGIHKNMLANYYISHDIDIITINSNGLNTENKESLKFLDILISPQEINYTQDLLYLLNQNTLTLTTDLTLI